MPSISLATSKIIRRLPADIKSTVLACLAELEQLDDEQDRKVAVATLVLAVKLELLDPDGTRRLN
jgi:hypothetical protein